MQCNRLFRNRATNISHQSNFHKKWNFTKEARKEISENQSEIDERLEKLITFTEKNAEAKRNENRSNQISLVKNGPKIKILRYYRQLKL